MQNLLSSIWSHLVIFAFFKNKLFIYLIFGCIVSFLQHAGFLLLQQAGATLRCGERASHCGGFPCCRARALGTWASVVLARWLSSCGSRALECRLSTCGMRTQQLWCTGLVALRHVGSSRTRAQTRVPCIGRQILKHRTTREVPVYFCFYFFALGD